MSRNTLSKEQKEKLQDLWNGGMTTTVHKDKIAEAVASTGLKETRVKDWIGNERKRKGVAGKPRKKSAYSVFKSDFLGSEEAKRLIADGVPAGDIQKMGSQRYRDLTAEEMQKYEELSVTQNNSLPDQKLSRETLIRKTIANIHANMKRLDELGCYSVWLGYSSGLPERLYSPNMADLASNEIFTNFVVSTMVNQQAKMQMEHEVAPAAHKKKKPKTGSSGGAKKPAGRTGPSTSTRLMSTSTSNSDPAPCVFTEGDHVEILDDGRRVAGEGIVTGQSRVHGRDLMENWVPVLVKEITSTIRPWQEYPTHSGQVETESFIAWPVDHLRRKTRNRVNISREAAFLKDQLHPDLAVSPGTLMSRDRQLRTRQQPAS